MNGDSGAVKFRSLPFPHWRHDSSRASVRFTGRMINGGRPPTNEVLRDLEGAPQRLAWLKQCHSAMVCSASTGDCGSGDALWTQSRGLALSVVTADCVPIVCGSRETVAAIHAGWRGLVAGVIGATLAELPDRNSELEAWIGPAIGSCCYEVGDDVASSVVAVSEPSIALTHSTGRTHLDLQRAAQFQLRKLGVERVHRVMSCTKCNPDLLWSYRGSSETGGTGGRNLTFAWLSGL